MQELVQNILEGNSLNEDQLRTLRSNVEKHPYSGTLQILLSKALKLRGDLEFEDAIRNAAIRTFDRKRLHDFVFAESEKLEKTSERTKPSEQPMEEESETTSHDPIPEEGDAIKDFDELFVAEALAAGAAIDLLEEGDSSVDESEETSAQIENEETEVEEQIVPPAQPQVPSKQSFSAWLNTMDDQSAEEVSNEPEVGADVTRPEERKEALDIIDHFIEQEEQIVPKRAEFFSAPKAAKVSIVDRDDIVTETLAQVYLTQGNIKKAISTYEKLSLLHPEKSSYFAALIEKLKNQKT